VRYLSVCSGIEAVSVAWGPLGWQPAMFAEIDPFCCWLLRSRHGASRPIHMPSPHDAPTRKEAKQRAAAIRNIVALPADGVVINAGDFTKIGADDVGPIDLLAGGTPCQSFSVAGKRAGLDDPRGNLTIEFARLAGRLRPLWLVWENVPGVLSIDNGRTFGAFLGMLVELGYGIAYRVLDAQHFGVPQRRRRVFVVGHLGNWRAAAAVLLERSSVSGYPPPRRKAREDLAPTLSARAHGGGGPGSHFDVDGGLIPIAHSLSADGFDASEDGTGRGVPMIPIAITTAHTKSNGSGLSDHIAHTLESGGAQAVAFAQNTRDEVRLPGGDGQIVGALAAQPGAKQQCYVAFSAKDHGNDAGDVAPTLRSMSGDGSHANGGGQIAVAFTQNQSGDVLAGDVMHSLGTNPNATGRNSATVAFTLHGNDGTSSTATPTEVAGSVRTKAPGSIENSSTTVAQHGMAVRRLTPRECERLQAFPDDYTLVEYRGKLASDGPRYKALGNSMAVVVMRWLGRRISAVDAILRDRPSVEESA
jgi:DNA (cytosine-5)-methyltransferase 1